MYIHAYKCTCKDDAVIFRPTHGKNYLEIASTLTSAIAMHCESAPNLHLVLFSHIISRIIFHYISCFSLDMACKLFLNPHFKKNKGLRVNTKHSKCIITARQSSSLQVPFCAGQSNNYILRFYFKHVGNSLH